MMQFVSQIMLAEIRATLGEKDKGSKYTVGSTLAILSTMNVIEYNGQRGLSEITKNFRTVLKMFDSEVPKEPMYHVVFNPMDLLRPVTIGESLLG